MASEGPNPFSPFLEPGHFLCCPTARDEEVGECICDEVEKHKLGCARRAGGECDCEDKDAEHLAHYKACAYRDFVAKWAEDSWVQSPLRKQQHCSCKELAYHSRNCAAHKHPYGICDCSYRSYTDAEYFDQCTPACASDDRGDKGLTWDQEDAFIDIAKLADYNASRTRLTVSCVRLAYESMLADADKRLRAKIEDALAELV